MFYTFFKKSLFFGVNKGYRTENLGERVLLSCSNKHCISSTLNTISYETWYNKNHETIQIKAFNKGVFISSSLTLDRAWVDWKRFNVDTFYLTIRKIQHSSEPKTILINASEINPVCYLSFISAIHSVSKKHYLVLAISQDVLFEAFDWAVTWNSSLLINGITNEGLSKKINKMYNVKNSLPSYREGGDEGEFCCFRKQKQPFTLTVKFRADTILH